MSIKESALSAITSISNSDFVRVVTSAGASRRITLNNLSKAITGDITFLKSAVDTAGKTFTLPASYRGLLFVFDSNRARNGMYMVSTTGAGVTDYKAISEANDITIDASVSNKITLTAATGSRVILFINAQGTVLG